MSLGEHTQLVETKVSKCSKCEMCKENIRALVEECARLEPALESLRNAEEERKLIAYANEIIYYLCNN